MKPTKLTMATVTAYGSWVVTWFRCSHCAPAEAMMVVSEIGEQWSPQTAPAQHAEMPMMSRLLSAGKTAVTIGIRMPNVPQLVPEAKARMQATTKMTAGSML